MLTRAQRLAPLSEGAAAMHCSQCGTRFPVIGGVPVLIDDATSVFALTDDQRSAGYAGPSCGREADGASGLRRLYHRLGRWLGDAPSSLNPPEAPDVLAHFQAQGASPRAPVPSCQASFRQKAGDLPALAAISRPPRA